MDESSLEQRLDNAHQSVVDDAVGKWRRGDVAPLRVCDSKHARRARPPGAPLEVLVYIDEARFPLGRKRQSFWRVALPALGLLVGRGEIVKSDNAVV